MKSYKKYLISEKAQISPYLSSMFKRTDEITKQEAEKLIKELNKLNNNMNYSLSLALEKSIQGKPLLHIKATKKEDVTEDGVEKALNNSGFKKIKTIKVDGNPAIVFTRK